MMTAKFMLFNPKLMCLICSASLLANTAAAAEIQSQTAAAPAVKKQFKVADVSLDGAGALRGVIVDAHGTPVENAKVCAFKLSRPVATTISNSNGSFVINDLPGGVYELVSVTPDGVVGHKAFRVWSAAAAPPMAASGAMIVPDQQVVRGQYYPPSLWGFLTRPWISAGIITTAIALPIALSNDGSAS